MPHRARNVLVVDDTDAHRYVMSSWLRRAGYTVTEAQTGSQALAAVGPELAAVVLDVNLPDMSGLDVCQAIKTSAETGDVPVLHVSATSIDARARTSGLQRGADAYLVEPLDRDEFLATVGALCRSHDARRGITEQARRLGQLAAALVPLNAAESPEAVVDAASVAAASVLATPVVVVATSADGMATRAVCAGPLAPAVRGRHLSPAFQPDTHGPTVYTPETAPSVWAEMLERAGVGPRTWLMIPLRDDHDRLLGGIAVATDAEDGVLPADERDLADQLAGALTVALSNLRSFAQEHQVAMTLQRSMLPHALPATRELQMAARYSASDSQLSVGGDFYDGVELPDGRVAAVIGDVQGHSLRAATVMAQLRFSLRAYLAEGHSPGRALELLNALLVRSHPEFVTVCLVVVDPRDGSVEVANAGHLPPLVVSPGSVRYVRTSTPLLGIPTDGPRRTERFAGGDDFAVVLVTDGLLERRTGHLADALDAMASTVGDASTLDPEHLCDLLLQRFDEPERGDDVALLAIRRRGDASAGA